MTQVVASLEPKATETGGIVADRLGVPFATATDLHEHDRGGVPFLSSEAAWHGAVRRLFDRPDELVLGRETANEAGERFARAVANVLQQHQTGNLAIVAHGTVISLFVARHNPIAPFALWERLGLPSFVVVSEPTFHLVEVTPEVI